MNDGEEFGSVLETVRKAPRAAAVMAGTGAVILGGALAWAWSRSRSRAGEAPGWPGSPAHWAPSDKQGVGTATIPSEGSTSLVWFTLGHGALTEVFYPRLHNPCTRDLALIVTDRRSFVSDERCDAHHELEVISGGALVFRQINVCKRGRYRIEKETVTNPRQDAVVQRVRFVPLRGDLDDYRLYAVLNPHMGLRRGIGSTGWVGRSKGRKLLFAQRGDAALALGVSAGWSAATAGFVGASDGLTDLQRHARLTALYERAEGGNVLLTGEIAPLACGGEFVLALGFGPAPEEAAFHASASLLTRFDVLRDDYVAGWSAWQAGLLPLEESGPGVRDLYRTSTAVLRSHEGKAVPGAIVASLSIPWGQARRDGNLGRGGYHMVWPRDLAEVAGGFLAAGAADDARRVLEYLRTTQDADGHWPQNMWVGGGEFWSSIQLGETSLPLLLIDLLHREGGLGSDECEQYWPMARKAVEYLLHFGPSSEEDRWENERGFTPYTLGSIIAALLVAAELADRCGEPDRARFLRETADAWNDDIDFLTYVEGTDLARRVGVDGYYLRIAPPDDRGEPIKDDRHLHFWYRPKARDQTSPADIVSCDALAYVRFGLRAPEDPRIVNTVKVIDAVLKVETPFGPCRHRYNHDGYGEKLDGSPFDDQRGHGRAWPLLTGERAHYELAAGRPDEAARLMRAVEQFAGDGGMIPEQVWDTYDIPEHDLYFGRPTGSAMPLAWAHAEYIKLRRSLRDGRVFDLPAAAAKRYLIEKVRSPHCVWRSDHRRRSMPAGKTLRIELRAPATIRWGTDGANGREVRTRDSGLGVHYADLPTADLPRGSTIQFSFSRPVGDRRKEGRSGPITASSVTVE